MIDLPSLLGACMRVRGRRLWVFTRAVLANRHFGCRKLSITNATKRLIKPTFFAIVLSCGEMRMHRNKVPCLDVPLIGRADGRNSACIRTCSRVIVWYLLNHAPLCMIKTVSSTFQIITTNLSIIDGPERWSAPTQEIHIRH